MPCLTVSVVFPHLETAAAFIVVFVPGNFLRLVQLRIDLFKIPSEPSVNMLIALVAFFPTHLTLYVNLTLDVSGRLAEKL
jgi:hypothetical protein